jgi:hypothetical protein
VAAFLQLEPGTSFTRTGSQNCVWFQIDQSKSVDAHGATHQVHPSNTISLKLPQGLRTGTLQLQPKNVPAAQELSCGIAVHAADETVLEPTTPGMQFCV